MALAGANSPAIIGGRRYLRAPVRLVFPVSETVPESRWHRRLCELLAESIERALAGRGLVSSDQFLYWDPANPKRCLAPDVAVRIGAPHELLKSWKTWERGAPHVGVEIVSDVDASELRFEEKLERYRQAGIAEIVRFERESSEPIRIWDWVDGDVVERDLADPEALRSDALGAFWCCYADPELGVMLRLANDRHGAEIWPTNAEAERAAREAERAAREAERVAKEAALARVAELEAELARRG